MGVNANLRLIADLFSLSGKIERRFFESNFTSSYFDAVYETNKLGFQRGRATHPFRKIAGSEGQDGTFGALYGHAFTRVLIGGSLQIPDEISRGPQGASRTAPFCGWRPAPRT